MFNIGQWRMNKRGQGEEWEGELEGTGKVSVLSEDSPGCEEQAR